MCAHSGERDLSRLRTLKIIELYGIGITHTYKKIFFFRNRYFVYTHKYMN